ncbi:haloacid dehalogenase [Reticulibacter mediterranei]|uniref:Haloacid dehalogenase n=1 Tax=Reticulibacter mediterranei TaxID=2778369 RepID=A0A8J3N1U7_9CHLR|nr:HAD family phosphatase [Reticulibacter mediterranei]GHO92948.1 haloacid dehalogenase [Reticulibacter mediterranei]
MITTIIFDFDGVQVIGLVGVEAYFRGYIDPHFQLSDFEGDELEQVYRGTLSEDAYWQALINKYHWNASVPQIKAIIKKGVQEIPGTRQIIETLKRNGYRLGLLSIHGREWVEHYEQTFNHHRLFDATLYSYEVGLCKPDPQVYEIILERLRARPEESLFIDDNLAYLEGARKIGMATLQFTSAAQLKHDLGDLGVRLHERYYISCAIEYLIDSNDSL